MVMKFRSPFSRCPTRVKKSREFSRILRIRDQGARPAHAPPRTRVAPTQYRCDTDAIPIAVFTVFSWL
jgi:hypothetical protein